MHPPRLSYMQPRHSSFPFNSASFQSSSLLCFIYSILVFVCASSLSGIHVNAAKIQWIGTDAEAAWSHPTSWNTSSIPTAADEIYFNLENAGYTPVIIPKNVNVAAIYISSSTYAETILQFDSFGPLVDLTVVSLHVLNDNIVVSCASVNVLITGENSWSAEAAFQLAPSTKLHFTDTSTFEIQTPLKIVGSSTSRFHISGSLHLACGSEINIVGPFVLDPYARINGDGDLLISDEGYFPTYFHAGTFINITGKLQYRFGTLNLVDPEQITIISSTIVIGDPTLHSTNIRARAELYFIPSTGSFRSDQVGSIPIYVPKLQIYGQSTFATSPLYLTQIGVMDGITASEDVLKPSAFCIGSDEVNLLNFVSTISVGQLTSRTFGFSLTYVNFIVYSAAVNITSTNHAITFLDVATLTIPNTGSFQLSSINSGYTWSMVSDDSNNSVINYGIFSVDNEAHWIVPMCFHNHGIILYLMREIVVTNYGCGTTSLFGPSSPSPKPSLPFFCSLAANATATNDSRVLTFVIEVPCTTSVTLPSYSEFRDILITQLLSDVLHNANELGVCIRISSGDEHQILPASTPKNITLVVILPPNTSNATLLRSLLHIPTIFTDNTLPSTTITNLPVATNLLRRPQLESLMVAEAADDDTGVSGDPQFVGFRNQKFQVHGIDGEIYNLISQARFQENARFVFLASGSSLSLEVLSSMQEVHLRHSPYPLQITSWSHPGSYLGEIGFKIQVGTHEHTIHAVSGSYRQGFAEIKVDGHRVMLNTSIVVMKSHDRDEDNDLETMVSESNGNYHSQQDNHESNTTVDEMVFELHYPHSHLVVLKTPWFKFTFDNSDYFINQRVQPLLSISQLVNMNIHGILGQTVRLTPPYRRAGHIPQLEGDVEDYSLTSSNIFGDDFVYNRYQRNSTS